MKIAICDDERTAIDILKDTLQKETEKTGAESAPFQTAGAMEIREFQGGEALLGVLRQGEGFDLILLDIDMPDADGIELGVQCRAILKSADTLLIYVSNRADRVFDSFKAQPFRFIPKSEIREKWPRVWQDILEEKNRQNRTIIIRTAGITEKYRVDEILYVESFGKKQLLHTTRGDINLSSSLGKLMDSLPEEDFMQIHKSYVVNLGAIRRIDHMDAVLDDGTVLMIGRSHQAEARQRFLNYALKHQL